MKQLDRFCLLLGALTFVTLSAHAAETNETDLLEAPAPAAAAATSTTPLQHHAYPSHQWVFEGLVQAHSVAAQGSPWLGLSAGYNFNPYLHLGVRGFLPIAQTVDKSSYALQAYGRVYFSGNDSTLRMFFEPDYAQNFLELTMFNSYGAAFGVMDRLQRHLSVGLMGGIEAAQAVVDSIGLERTSSYAVYPKIAMLADFAF